MPHASRLSRTHLACIALITVKCAMNAPSATITWDGGGGTSSWQTPANWSTDALPGAGDDVLINAGGGVTIASGASVTIRSLQCSNNLALSAGTFQVTGGNSVVQGNLSVTGNPIISASGAFTTFALPGATNVDGLGVEALNGARVSLPNLPGFHKAPGCVNVIWQAIGAGSVLEAPALTNLTGATCASYIVQALSGGSVLMTNLTTIADGTLYGVADGVNSLLDFASLKESPGTRLVSFEVRNFGTISMPEFPGDRNVTAILKVTGSLPIEQFTELSGFTVSGTNANFLALTNIADGNVNVSSNAVVLATNVMNHVTTADCRAHDWIVTGAGSVLDLSGLTNMVGSGCGWINLEASAGATLVASNVTTLGEGSLYVTADGTNSIVNLSGLQQCTAAIRTVQFTVSRAGTILMPQFTGGPRAFVSLQTGGALPAGQMTELSGFSVTGMNIEFTALTNLTIGDVSVSGGGTVSLPELQSHEESSECLVNSWQVSGAGSILDLSHLTNLTGTACGSLLVSATSGGLMIVSNLPSVEGITTFRADGGGSRVNLDSLSQIPGTRTVSFNAWNGGEIVAPQLTGNANVFVSVISGGIFPVEQVRRLLGFTVTGMSANFAALTNLSTGDVTVSGGGMATAPALTQYSEASACLGNMWLATGAGSVLDFSSLTNVTGPNCGSLSIQAKSGGYGTFGALTGFGEGVVAGLADGSNSVLNFSALSESQVTNHSVSFEARNYGTIIFPAFQGGQTVAITLRSGGTLDTAELKLLKSLTVSGTSLNLPGITNLFSGDLNVEDGAVLILPNLFSHSQASVCGVNNWTVTGVNSVLDLSSMTNLSGPGCGSLTLNALAGGSMNLSNLTTILDGTLAFVADATNSRIDLANLDSSLATTRPVSFEVRNRGTISMPQMPGGPTVSITIKTNGILSIGQLARLKNVTVLATNITLPSLTNADSGSFTVTAGGMLAAPALASYTRTDLCTPATWIADGTNSVLDLSAMNEVIGGGCAWLSIIATNGGEVRLPNLGAIPSGTVYLTSAGSGSMMSLLSLSNYFGVNLSKLAATNGGAIQLNDAPLFLSGVKLDFAANTPGFPLTYFAPTNLVMHGHAWRSYWVEKRDSTSPLNPWEFFRRVPLTNDFEIIGPPVPANTELRGYEFVADPFALELTPRPDEGLIGLVLYGPTNHTFTVETVTNVEPPVLWATRDIVSLTNTFRILPSETNDEPKRFFRVN